MIIVRAARLDRCGVGAAGSGGTHPLGDDFVILGTYLNASAPEASSQLMSPFSPGAPASATTADYSGPAARDVPHCVSLRAITMQIHFRHFPERHHPRQRQRHCAGGAYLTVARRRETGRRDRKRLRVTLRRLGLQGENPGKKERS